MGWVKGDDGGERRGKEEKEKERRKEEDQNDVMAGRKRGVRYHPDLSSMFFLLSEIQPHPVGVFSVGVWENEKEKGRERGRVSSPSGVFRFYFRLPSSSS